MPASPILGLDLSLTATGIVVVPVRWGLKWSRIRVAACGHPLSSSASERERYRRIDGIAMLVLDYATRYRCKVAAIEQYAFSKSAGHAHERGELGGVVKRVLFAAGVDVVVYAATSARKTLGTAPPKDAKSWAHERLLAAGAPSSWTGDQLDAFLQANNHLSIIGGDALMLPAEAA